MTPRAVVIYCGLLMSMQAFSVDIMLPAFPAMVDDLAAPYSQVQWTLTFYMFMAGFAQLIWGPLSDRVGRKPVLAAGLSIYLAGCLMSALAPSIWWLLAGRLLQGLGGATAMVLARTIARDLFHGQELARNLASMTAIFAFGPIVAPLVGAAIATPLGWRAVFGGLAIFGLLLLLGLTRLPETIQARARDAIAPKVMGERLRRLFTNSQSRYFMLLAAIIMSSMVLILTSAPRLYDVRFGLAGSAFAAFFAVHGVGIVIGQTLNRRLIPRLGIVRAMLVGNAVLIVSASLILAFAIAGMLNEYLTTALLILYATSYLVVYSNATALVLDPHGEIAGFAAALFGFVSQIGAAVAVSVIVLFTGDSLVGFGGALLGICLLCFTMVASWHFGRR